MKTIVLALAAACLLTGCQFVATKHEPTNLVGRQTTVTASGYESKAHGGWGDFPPELTLDGDMNANSSWRAETTDPTDPQWIRYDLGETKSVCGLRLAFVKGDTRRYAFTVEASDDGEDWTEIFSGRSSGTTAGFETFSPGAATEARYVRIVGLGNTNEKFANWTNIVETEILGY